MKMRMRATVVGFGIGFGLAVAGWCGAQQGAWRAVSKTAKAITGDVVLSGGKIGLNFSNFTIAEIRGLTAADAGAVFDDAPAGGSGGLYRTSLPGNKKFLHNNTLCAGEDVQWLVAYATRDELRLAMFSGEKMPGLTAEAMASSTELCGTYLYGR